MDSEATNGLVDTDKTVIGQILKKNSRRFHGKALISADKKNNEVILKIFGSNLII